MNNFVETQRITKVRFIKNILLGLSLCAISANAQQVVGSVRAPAPNGLVVSVPVVMQSGLGDDARGWNGVVYVDPKVRQMPYEFQQMLFAHEAYHAIWHSASETDADAFAGRVLRIAGFSPAQMDAVLRQMIQFLSPTGDASHPPASTRVQIVRQAYGM